MRRTSLAALLAAPLLLVFPANLPANPPSQCFGPFGGGGFCIGLFSKLHQHGPLFNYGPYYGYPPFEPYGPWNAYLQYNPWYYGTGGSSGHSHGGLFNRCGSGRCGDGCGHFHTNWLHGGWFRGHGCVSCGSHGLFHGGLFHGCKSCGKSDCGTPNTCGGSCATASQDPVSRFAGTGAPADYANFYSALPTLGAITPAGGAR